MPRLRIALLRMPRLLREFLTTTLDAQPDMCTVDAPDLETRAPSAAPVGTFPDVVIVERDPNAVVVDGVPANVATLLGRHPALTALVIDARDGEASLYQLRPHRVRIGDPSLQAVVDLIRDGARALGTRPLGADRSP